MSKNLKVNLRSLRSGQSHMEAAAPNLDMAKANKTATKVVDTLEKNQTDLSADHHNISGGSGAVDSNDDDKSSGGDSNSNVASPSPTRTYGKVVANHQPNKIIFRNPFAKRVRAGGVGAIDNDGALLPATTTNHSNKNNNNSNNNNNNNHSDNGEEDPPVTAAGIAVDSSNGDVYEPAAPVAKKPTSTDGSGGSIKRKAKRAANKKIVGENDNSVAGDGNVPSTDGIDDIDVDPEDNSNNNNHNNKSSSKKRRNRAAVAGNISGDDDVIDENVFGESDEADAESDNNNNNNNKSNSRSSKKNNKNLKKKAKRLRKNVGELADAIGSSYNSDSSGNYNNSYSDNYNNSNSDGESGNFNVNKRNQRKHSTPHSQNSGHSEDSEGEHPINNNKNNKNKKSKKLNKNNLSDREDGELSEDEINDIGNSDNVNKQNTLTPLSKTWQNAINNASMRYVASEASELLEKLKAQTKQHELQSKELEQLKTEYTKKLRQVKTTMENFEKYQEERQQSDLADLLKSKKQSHSSSDNIDNQSDEEEESTTLANSNIVVSTKFAKQILKQMNAIKNNSKSYNSTHMYTHSVQPKPLHDLSNKSWKKLSEDVAVAESVNMPIKLESFIDAKWHDEIGAKLYAVNPKWFHFDTANSNKWKTWKTEIFFKRIKLAYMPHKSASSTSIEARIEQLTFKCTETNNFDCVDVFIRQINELKKEFEIDEDAVKEYESHIVKAALKKIRSGGNAGSNLQIRLCEDGVPKDFDELRFKWAAIQRQLHDAFAIRDNFKDKDTSSSNSFSKSKFGSKSKSDHSDKPISKKRDRNNNEDDKEDSHKKKKYKANTGTLDMTELRDGNGVCRACGGDHNLPGCFNVINGHKCINTDKDTNWKDCTHAKQYKKNMESDKLMYKFWSDGREYVSDYVKKPKSSKNKTNNKKGNEYLTLLNVVYNSNVESLRTSVETSYTIPCNMGLLSTDNVFIPYFNINVLIDTGALQANYVSSSLAKKFNKVRLGVENKTASCNNSNNCCKECLYTKNCAHSKNLLVPSNNNDTKAHTKVCSGLAGVPCAETLGELQFDLRIPITPGTKVQIVRDISATILDTPYDLILGRPDIIRYDLLDILSPMFKVLKDKELMDIRESEGHTHMPNSATEQIQRNATFSPENLNIIIKKDDILDKIIEDDGISDLEEEIPGLDDKDIDKKTKVEPQYLGSPDLINKLKELVKEFDDIFSEEVKPIPADLEPMIVNIDKAKWQTKKNQLPPRSQTRAKEYEIERQINKMIANNVIKPSQAAFYSHVHMTPKSNGKWRFCIDYRALNNVTESMGWPIPNVSKMLQRLGSKKAKYYATLDLTSGYHQAPLSKQSQSLSAFTTFMGVYEWLRVPMGLKAAPSHFQKQIAERVLCGLIYHICEVYIDDIIIFGGTETELLERLRTVFLRFRKFGLTLNPEKCKFGMSEVEYVGHTINEKGLTFSRAKLGTVLDFPEPKDHESMKSFLGLVNYFRDHIRNLSIIVKPLSQMIDGKYSKKQPIHWTAELRQLFNEVKQLVANCPTLSFLNDKLPIYLHTDASDYGIGGYLFQIYINEDGVEVEIPIAFFSQSLSKEQLNWSVPEKEAFAIVQSLKKFEYLIRDVYFILRTDHKNLTFVNAEGSDKIKRWKMVIQHYNFDIEHLKGELNVVADAFSRLVVNKRLMASNEETLLVRSEMKVTGLPAKIWKRIGKVHNSLVGHNGVDRTISKLEAQGIEPWPYMREQIKYFIQHCPVCQKLEVRANKNFTEPFTTAVYEPMHTISIDAIGPVPEDAQGYKYILTIIDNFTRFVELYPIISTTGPEATRCLIQFIGRYGAPRYFKTDQGSQFVNELMTQFVNIVGVTHQLTLAYSHQENGIVERANREVNKHIRAIVFDYKVVRDWSVYLPLVQRIINSSYHSSIKMAPATLLFGNTTSLDKRIILSPEKSAAKQNVTISEWAINMQQMQAQYLEAAKKAQKETDEIHMIESPAGLTEFAVNSYVLVQYRTQPPSKFHMKWAGPLRVVKVVNANTYSLQDLVTLKIKDYHLTQIKPFLYNPNEIDPVDVARKEQQEFVVSQILGHRGDPKRRLDLEFLVSWEGYSEEFNSWEPWEYVKDNIVLNQYLYNNKLKRHLTKEQKVEVEDMMK